MTRTEVRIARFSRTGRRLVNILMFFFTLFYPFIMALAVYLFLTRYISVNVDNDSQIGKTILNISVDKKQGPL